MSSNKRPILEEVDDDDDIDNMDMDIAEFDPNLTTPIAPKRPQPTIVRSQDLDSNLNIEPPLFPNNIPLNQIQIQNQLSQKPSSNRNGIIDPNSFTPQEKEQFNQFQIIYPCYFDINRSHKQGRRVSIDKAVENPLATTISDACKKLGLPVFLELDKTHPQDFGNPGRVKVLFKAVFDNGKLLNSKLSTKRILFNVICEYLNENPTTLESIEPKNNGIPYPPEFNSSNNNSNDFQPEEIPKVKGFKMNTIVPIHSNLTLKHPMTKHIYDPEPEPPIIGKSNVPKLPKKKVMKIRG
ncbi:signal recognition particle subunit sec65 homologue, putative [Candida dubliniensis CD36]|uniref:Signal recognition particle SEC65 subunit n=1 Tax=Candida dubliniensis (strain CD36 / ATCC MYA-646 / CBS 7987 / NCPF 3949 / NRRL Y-17841) TaxID=573826 RepID=B9WKZ3_CANDC|nr:signal recognition particle subunit sec65 homologue, putative [Candida dubliniensis CD36]CAX39695.1 signal recognition particle subunit sec65 homologue, putative [Candida dubliniensis CD36]